MSNVFKFGSCFVTLYEYYSISGNLGQIGGLWSFPSQSIPGQAVPGTKFYVNPTCTVIGHNLSPVALGVAVDHSHRMSVTVELLAKPKHLFGNVGD